MKMKDHVFYEAVSPYTTARYGFPNATQVAIRAGCTEATARKHLNQCVREGTLAKFRSNGRVVYLRPDHPALKQGG